MEARSDLIAALKQEVGHGFIEYLDENITNPELSYALWSLRKNTALTVSESIDVWQNLEALLLAEPGGEFIEYADMTALNKSF